jgi:LuxR family maltose regulon positive regulatory protein
MDSFLRAKLYPPVLQTPSLVVRSRLLARLNEGWLGNPDTVPRKLTLFCAPAGYGKTTLAAQWLYSIVGRGASRSAPTLAWLTLDEAENDVGRFIAYLTAAFREAGLEPGDEMAALGHTPNMPPPEHVAAILCNLLERTPPLLLALDDYHHIQNPYVHDLITHLLAHLLPSAHLVLLTREEPPFSLARLRGSGEMVEIRQGDIAFSEKEAKTFLNEKMGLSLTPKEIALLEQRTEGWIAGLQLAALALRDQPLSTEPNSVEEFVSAFAGSKQFILDYLLDEVFRRQPEDVREFLLQTAVLDRMCASLCTAVTRRPGCQTMLQKLQRDNLFLVHLDNERQWYRYHHLFADLLRYRLSLEALPVEELHGRAASWFSAHGFGPEAIQHALAARDWPLAADLIAAAAEDNLRQGRISTLLHWIDALPPEIMKARPDLSLAASWALALTARLDEAETLMQNLMPMVQQSPELESELLPLQVHIARARHDAPRTIALSERALALLAPDDANGRSLLYVSLGAAYLYEGKLDQAAGAWAAAARDGRMAANYHAAALALTFLGQLRAAHGRLHEAADLHRQAIQLGDNEDALPVTARAHANLAALLYEWDDLTNAVTHLQQALELSELVGDLHARRDALRLLTLVQQAQGETAAALQSIRKADELLHQFQVPENGHLAVALTHMQVALALGDLAMATRWQKRIDDLMPEGTLIRPDLLANAACLIPLPALLQAQLLLAQGDRKSAAQLLASCYNAAVSGNFGYLLVNTRLRQALAEPEFSLGIELMAEALSYAQAEEYLRSFMIDNPSPVELLRQTASRHPHLAPYVCRLLALLVEPIAPPGPTEILADPLSDRELEVLRLLDQHMTNAEIASELMLSPNTIKTHLRHIYEKMGVHDRRQAITRAHELRLI